MLKREGAGIDARVGNNGSLMHVEFIVALGSLTYRQITETLLGTSSGASLPDGRTSHVLQRKSA